MSHAGFRLLKATFMAVVVLELIGCIGLTASLTSQAAVYPQSSQAEKSSIPILIPGREESFSFEQMPAQSYTVDLNAGQFAVVRVTQRGVDVQIKVTAPDGSLIVNANRMNALNGEEPVYLLAATPGRYQLDVSPVEGIPQGSSYLIQLLEIRQPTETDQARVLAQKYFAEAEVQLAKGTAEGLMKAIEGYEKAIPFYKQTDDLYGEANVLTNIGAMSMRLRKLDTAVICFEKALPMWEKLNDNNSLTVTMAQLGQILFSEGKFDKARLYFERGLELSRSIDDQQAEGISLFSLGLIQNSLGDFGSALEYFRQAEVIFTKLGMHFLQAGVKLRIGETLFHLGEAVEAINPLEEAIRMFKSLNNRWYYSLTLVIYGNVFRVLGDYQKALAVLQEALEIKKQIGDLSGQAFVLNSLGVLYKTLGNNLKAIDCYQSALAIRETQKDLPGQASTLHNLGDAYGANGEFELALTILQKSLTLSKALGNSRLQIQTQQDIGLAYRALKRIPEAEQIFQETLSQAINLKQQDQLGNLYFQLGQFASERKDWVKAQDLYQQSIKFTEKLLSPLEHAQSLKGLAETEVNLGNYRKARELGLESVLLFDRLRSNLVQSDLRLSFQSSQARNYKELVMLFLLLHQKDPNQGHDRIAFEISERARARVLLELLTESKVDIREGCDPTLLAEEKKLRQTLTAKYAAWTELLGKVHKVDQEVKLKRDIQSTESALQQLDAKIRETSPKYAALTQIQPLTTDQIQQVISADTQLVEYSFREVNSYAWVVTPNNLAYVVLPGKEKLDPVIEKVSDALTQLQPQPQLDVAERKRVRAEAETRYWKAATELSELILEPLRPHLKGPRLLLVADGKLQYIPFAALPFSKENPERETKPVAELLSKEKKNPEPRTLNPEPQAVLLDSFELITLPSASILTALSKPDTTNRPQRLAIFADPVFRSEEVPVTNQSAPLEHATPNRNLTKAELLGKPTTEQPREPAIVQQLNIQRLPFTRIEAEEISKLFPAEQVLKAIAFDASLDKVRTTDLTRYSMLHFATHGLLDTDNPELSAVVLSLVDRDRNSIDGFLRLGDIYNLKLNADLVVLSACQTGIGQEQGGEGLIGLTRGFLYAGARRVVASLWMVDDQATSELMKRFYQNMLGPEKMKPGQALRAAQLSIRKERAWKSPFYWAAFQVQGQY
ncbi:MAG: CHAT domain-containing protein [Acidobacteria bacterium]|nr:CHAT domain-containing protein [Acidobacteriota bacterium]